MFRHSFRVEEVTLIPFYGGGKGQSLQIVRKKDGTVLTNIIKTPNVPSDEGINITELENPPLPSKQDLEFGSNLRNIHRTAINIINLQDMIKKNGKLSGNQETFYKENMDSLNNSAKKLAEMQDREDFENREGLTEWFERKKTIKKENDKKKENKKEEKKPEEEENEEAEESGDVVSVGLPPDNASVAEAKPVGLAVAGEGGVAASKPIATAVVGPGGLAIARPVGTAIAGVAPDQALVPIYAEGYIAGTKPKRYNSTQKSDSTSELLNRIISKYHQA